MVNLGKILGSKVDLPTFFFAVRMCILHMPHIISGNKHLINAMSEKLLHLVPQFLGGLERYLALCLFVTPCSPRKIHEGCFDFCHLLYIIPKQPFLSSIFGVFLRPLKHIHEGWHLRVKKLIPARGLHLVKRFRRAGKVRRNPLAAALVLVQEGENRTHFRAVLVLREKCLCAEIVLDALPAPAQGIQLLHGCADCVLQLLDVRCALLDRKTRHHGGCAHQSVAHVANVVIRALCHFGDEFIIPVGKSKERTLDALNAVGVRVSVLVEVRIHLVFPDKFMQNARDKAAVCSGREIPFVIRDVGIQHGIGDFLRICVRGFACTHPRPARGRADDVLHQSVRNIPLHLADKRRILDALNILFGKPECRRILHEVVFVC